MKFFTAFLTTILLASISVWGQNSVNINGNLSSCNLDTLLFFELDGVSLRPVAKIPLTKTESAIGFVLEINDLPKGFYLLGGGSQNNTRLMILGDEPEINITGQCKTFNKAPLPNSADNKLYEAAIKQSNEMSRKFNGMINQYRLARRDPVALKSVEERMAKLDQEKVDLLNSLKEKDDFIAKAIALRTYVSYQNNKETNQTEAEYFGKNFFQFVDFSDKAYNTMPLVHDNFRSYAQTLTRVGLLSKRQIGFADGWLDSIPDNSRAEKLALLGLIAGFRGQNEDAFVRYAGSLPHSISQ